MLYMLEDPRIRQFSLNLHCKTSYNNIKEEQSEVLGTKLLECVEG